MLKLEELAAEREELEKKQKQIELDKKRLNAPLNRRHWYQRSWRCTRCRVRLTKARDSSPDPIGTCPNCKKEQKFVNK